MEAVGTARLTDRIPAERAVAASIPRREITDVLHEADATPELTLDVVAGEGSREHGTISITWSRDELERLLDGASGEDVVLTFDRNEGLAAAVALDSAHEQPVLHALTRYPEIIEQAAVNRAPHTLVHYLRDLANVFHTYYNAEQFIVDDPRLRNARLALVLGVQQVLRNGLSLLGVSAPESM